MLSFEIAPDTEVQIPTSTKGVVTFAEFWELLDTALQVTEVRERILLHPCFFRAQNLAVAP